MASKGCSGQRDGTSGGEMGTLSSGEGKRSVLEQLTGHGYGFPTTDGC